MTQLATSMAGSALVRVNVTHDYGVQKFEQDLKKAVLAAGIDAKHTVFLLKDAQVCSMVWDLPFVGSSLGPPKCSLHLSLSFLPLLLLLLLVRRFWKKRCLRISTACSAAGRCQTSSLQTRKRTSSSECEMLFGQREIPTLK